MTSVERVQEYHNITPEADHERRDVKPSPSWPEYGAIEFNNISFAQYEGGEDVLHKITLNIKAHEKVCFIILGC